MFRQLDRPVF